MSVPATALPIVVTRVGSSRAVDTTSLEAALAKIIAPGLLPSAEEEFQMQYPGVASEDIARLEISFEWATGAPLLPPDQYGIAHAQAHGLCQEKLHHHEAQYGLEVTFHCVCISDHAPAFACTFVLVSEHRTLN